MLDRVIIHLKVIGLVSMCATLHWYVYRQYLLIIFIQQLEETSCPVDGDPDADSTPCTQVPTPGTQVPIPAV